MTLCRVPGEGPEMAAGAAPAPLSSRSRGRAPGSGRAAPGGAAAWQRAARAARAGSESCFFKMEIRTQYLGLYRGVMSMNSE